MNRVAEKGPQPVRRRVSRRFTSARIYLCFAAVVDGVVGCKKYESMQNKDNATKVLQRLLRAAQKCSVVEGSSSRRVMGILPMASDVPEPNTDGEWSERIPRHLNETTSRSPPLNMTLLLHCAAGLHPLSRCAAKDLRTSAHVLYRSGVRDLGPVLKGLQHNRTAESVGKPTSQNGSMALCSVYHDMFISVTI